MRFKSRTRTREDCSSIKIRRGRGMQMECCNDCSKMTCILPWVLYRIQVQTANASKNILCFSCCAVWVRELTHLGELKITSITSMGYMGQYTGTIQIDPLLSWLLPQLLWVPWQAQNSSQIHKHMHLSCLSREICLVLAQSLHLVFKVEFKELER